MTEPKLQALLNGVPVYLIDPGMAKNIPLSKRATNKIAFLTDIEFQQLKAILATKYGWTDASRIDN